MRDNDFLVNSIDRSSELRRNKLWITEKFQDENTRIVPIFQSAVLCSNSQTSEAIYLSYSKILKYINDDPLYVFMGFYNGVAYYTLDISLHEQAEALCKDINGCFKDYKSIMLMLDKSSCELLLLARFLNYWHIRNKFCGKCGHKTASEEAGHVLICQNEVCNERYYPNMDPAIIVLVSSAERCLLGRQKDWPAGMYSTLAGYVEPGETIEQAVAREVHEESAININAIQYQGSQSWLSPNSLMLGFTAQAINEDIVFDTHELEDVRWFTRQEINSTEGILPYKNTIAYQLIVDWLDHH